MNLVNIMKENEIDCFDISDGKLMYTKSKVKQALSKKIDMFYQAMSWDNPIDKRYTLEKFF